MRAFLNCILSYVLILSCMVANTVGAYESTKEESDCVRQFTFSWSLHDECGLSPRGGTTKGAKIELDKAPHEGWLALQKTGLSEFEKDRLAILAMAGPYRTSFDFLEVLGYTSEFSPDRPYQSWGTEYVYVVEDRGDFISLQHIMVMFFEDKDGKMSEPMVMKHWRQDWQYQKRNVFEYKGHNTWKKKKLSKKSVKGTWAQAVFQVDDSPRYEAIGRWEHRKSFSTWESNDTWRPLPRREHSVRDDYHVLEGVNRHTILPSGWVHEQENYKLVLNKDGTINDEQAYLAKEIGLNRYEKIVNHDFSAGDSYWEETQAYWRDVREYWDNLIQKKGLVTLKKKVDNLSLFMPIFQGASEHKGTEYKKENSQQYISDVIGKYME